MKKIVDAVVKELEGKNAGLDVTKMCVRVAIAASGLELTREEAIEVMMEVKDKTSFNPFEPVLELVSK